MREAPLYDPMELKIHNYNLTLRKSEAKLIEVNMI
ncbi:FeoA family protein [Aliarcobacter butzleri]